MHMPVGIIPDALLAFYSLLALAGVGYAVWRTGKGVLFDTEQGRYLGMTYGLLCGLYLLSAGVYPGMTVHFLGVMLTVMMFGPWLAIVLLAMVHLTLLLGFGIGAPTTLGFNLTLTVLLPVAVAAAVHTFCYHRLPRTFPVYILQVGVGDLLCMVAVDAALSLHLLLLTSYRPDTIASNFSVILLMMGGVEATISTMLASLLIYFLPRALTTFSDEEYLRGK